MASDGVFLYHSRGRTLFWKSCLFYSNRRVRCWLCVVRCKRKLGGRRSSRYFLETLLKGVNDTATDFVVITGGEPAMYPIETLVSALQEQGIEVAIETSGCYPLDAKVDWYCFSPKKFKAPVEEAYEKANELKVVIFNKHDFKWAEEHAAKANADCLLYLQPEWSKGHKCCL